MQKDIELFVAETKKQAKEIEKLKNSRDEVRAMYHEENRKILYETQHYKDKVDQLKTELYEMKKINKETMGFKTLYEEVKQREDEKQEKEIKMRTIEEIKRQTEKLSLVGHLKQVKLTNTQTQKISCFSMETFKYLEYDDLRKLVCLNRRFAQTFLKYNWRLFVRMYN